MTSFKSEPQTYRGGLRSVVDHTTTSITLWSSFSSISSEGDWSAHHLVLPVVKDDSDEDADNTAHEDRSACQQHLYNTTPEPTNTQKIPGHLRRRRDRRQERRGSNSSTDSSVDSFQLADCRRTGQCQRMQSSAGSTVKDDNDVVAAVEVPRTEISVMNDSSHVVEQQAVSRNVTTCDGDSALPLSALASSFYFEEGTECTRKDEETANQNPIRAPRRLSISNCAA